MSEKHAELTLFAPNLRHFPTCFCGLNIKLGQLAWRVHDSRKFGLGQRLDTRASSSNADRRASALQLCEFALIFFEQGDERWHNPRSQEPSSLLFCSQPLACDGQTHPMKADLKRWWGCNRTYFEHCIAHWHISAVRVLVWSRSQTQQTQCGDNPESSLCQDQQKHDKSVTTCQ